MPGSSLGFDPSSFVSFASLSEEVAEGEKLANGGGVAAGDINSN